MTLTIEDMAVFCKKKGFVYPNSEIYGGLAGFWDYGPLGTELKNNIKSQWWKFHVQSRNDIVGIDGSIITHPRVWKASGHVDNFTDVYVKCKKCKKPNKLDKNEIGKVKCDCGGEYEIIGELNLMFRTNVGPIEGNTTFLRPETAQLMFTNFRLVAENARLKLPFGIAQIGRAFRNEISPRDFLFRCREFEQMEIEYFIDPKDTNKCLYIKEILDHKISVYSAEMQDSGEKDGKQMTMKDALKNKIIKTQWHAYWLATEHKWFTNLGAKPDNFRIRQHVSDEKSHYALDTWDLEYKFPFGWKELQGIANRTDFDLKQHMKFSNTDLSLYDEESKEKIIPHVVAEPSQGVDRAFLVFMFDAYEDNKERGNIILHLDPKLAPVKVGIFPLINKLNNKAMKIYNKLKDEFTCQFDKSGSIGRRYARADEIGIPYCITIDFEEDRCATIRDRETTEQKRVKITKLKETITKLLNKEIEFKDIK
ncbi:glycine--tRNA ligase [Candidatus Woesearchaeota archaeon]|nr:glycine--tRNA ligase [Candidatus Woesearchaeota archaeon]